MSHPAHPLSCQPDVRLRLRIMREGQIAIGPGKVALLEAIRDHGSISAAARHLGMSYRRAWLLVDELNAAMIEPATASGPGGSQGGGSHLTPTGEAIIVHYRSVEQRALDACASELAALQALVRPP